MTDNHIHSNKLNPNSDKEALTPEQRDALNADPITDEPGSHPVGTGIGTAFGASAGAAIGLAGGPVGAVIGGIAGGIAGALAGHNTAEKFNPTIEEAYWRDTYTTTPYYQSATDKYGALDYDQDYGSAYRLGYESRIHSPDYTFEDIEPELATKWEQAKNNSHLKWEEAREATRDSWNRVNGYLNTADGDPEDIYWRENYIYTPYYHNNQEVYGDLDYDRDYRNAYQFGYKNRPNYDKSKKFEDVEDDLSSKWEQFKGESRLKWEHAKYAVRDAWNRWTN